MTGLMVTGRAGSAMAAELGSMKVTEQIEAFCAMAVNPVDFLVVPRVVASAFAVMCNSIGPLGVGVLGINSSLFVNKMLSYIDSSDLFSGPLKAFFFGIILSRWVL